MASLERLWTAARALVQLGPPRMAENGLYRLGLKLNAFKIPQIGHDERAFPINLDILPALPVVKAWWEKDQTTAQAQEITAGYVRLFGGDPLPIDLSPILPLYPWSDYELGRVEIGTEDIKFTWEPARFNWAIQLMRAYQLTNKEEYAAVFWKYLETFLAANPPYQGPNWTSGQEAALRIIAWAFVIKGFAPSASSTLERMQILARSIAAHASRIPPTLIYARSQNNNHLLSEAAGLYTAGLLLPGHPGAEGWRRTGWKWFNRGVQRQLEAGGAYIQQSTNYHRLMLHLALWVNALAKATGDPWPAASLKRLQAAAGWLHQRLDPNSGQVPNFGHNDGSNLFPLGEYGDYRPTVQAARIAFTGHCAFKIGPWDELSERLGLRIAEAEQAVLEVEKRKSTNQTHHDATGAILRSENCWVGLRAGRLTDRPGQADQLQVDLWWRGMPVFLDAGTYRYTAGAPWDNGLASGFAHNSVTVDGREPMTRAGRFLWLDWDQAEIETCIPTQIVGRRSGYQKLGVQHRRSVQFVENGLWKVTDDFTPSGRRSLPHTFTAHWLLPDWPYQFEGTQLSLASPRGSVLVNVDCSAPTQPDLHLQIIRAGELRAGEGDFPEISGWWSPTYNTKLPALSLRASFSGRLPARLTTFIALDRPSISR